MPESNIFSMRGKKLGFLAKNSFFLGCLGESGVDFFIPKPGEFHQDGE
jgi:hypothetical protein